MFPHVRLCLLSLWPRCTLRYRNLAQIDLTWIRSIEVIHLLPIPEGSLHLSAPWGSFPASPHNLLVMRSIIYCELYQTWNKTSARQMFFLTVCRKTALFINLIESSLETGKLLGRSPCRRLIWRHCWTFLLSGRKFTRNWTPTQEVMFKSGACPTGKETKTHTKWSNKTKWNVATDVNRLVAISSKTRC